MTKTIDFETAEKAEKNVTRDPRGFKRRQRIGLVYAIRLAIEPIVSSSVNIQMCAFQEFRGISGEDSSSVNSCALSLNRDLLSPPLSLRLSVIDKR